MAVSTTPRFRRRLMRLAMGDPLIGQRVRRARDELGMSQAEFANAIGLKHPQSVSNYERGIDEVPADRLRKISQLTGKTVAWFLDGDDDAAKKRPEGDGPIDRYEERLARIESLLQRLVDGDEKRSA